ncbi:MAG: hypothetical protein ACOY0T_28480 [Myxococcota bacterium]
MSDPEKPRSGVKNKREAPQLPARARTELALVLNEARALLTAAHVIESTLGPLAWYLTSERVQAAAASVRKQSPNLVERLLNVCTRMERLALLTAAHAAARPESGSRVSLPVETAEEEKRD